MTARQRDIIERIKRQLDASDSYAKDHRPKNTVGQTVWEIQNDHLRSLVAELEAAK